MLFKIIAVATLVVITVSLFMALASLVKGEGATGKTVKMLSYRVGFSAFLLIFLGLAKFMGWMEPHGVSASVEPGDIPPSTASDGRYLNPDLVK